MPKLVCLFIPFGLLGVLNPSLVRQRRLTQHLNAGILLLICDILRVLLDRVRVLASFLSASSVLDHFIVLDLFGLVAGLGGDLLILGRHHTTALALLDLLIVSGI